MTNSFKGLVITPLPAGHMMGGTIWRIVKVAGQDNSYEVKTIVGQDGEEDIVYAVDYNHKKERHLNGCDIEHIKRPR